MKQFTYNSAPTRVVFGTGTIAEVGNEVRRLGRGRVLVVADPALARTAEQVCEHLGPLTVARFDGAAMHTPTDVTARALELAEQHSVDCVVAVGGGSTTGLSKALAVRGGYDQVIVPTTYAGSEATPVLGETDNGVKTTRSAPEILPETVIYDVDLTVGLPVDMTVTSAINALAHAVEALYSPDANPVIDAMALEAIRAIGAALPRVVADPTDLGARAELLEAAWLAGTCLGAVGMGLHHKLCHTLGGSFDLPHAQTHTVVLPHVMAYNAAAAPEVMARIAAALRVPDAPAGVFDLITAVGGPTSLRELGMASTSIAKAATLATTTPYPNPRELTHAGVETVLEQAWLGRRPGGGGAFPQRALTQLTREVVDSFAGATNPRVQQLLGNLVLHAHQFVAENDVTQDEWTFAIDFLTRTGHLCGPTRQEFVLLSDTLGISSAVDILTNSRSTDTTPSAVLGPFYVDGPPPTENGADLAKGLPGIPLWADIRVTDPSGVPVTGSVVDVWQSNEDGFYDVQLPELEGPVLRARFTTDSDGRCSFWSILPSEYPIPNDGPVGQMLDAAGRHPFRAPHLHFLVQAPGYRQLITQLFVAGGDYLDSDAVFGVKDALIVNFVPHRGPTPDGRVVDGEWRRLDFNIRIAHTQTRSGGKL